MKKWILNHKNILMLIQLLLIILAFSNLWFFKIRDVTDLSFLVAGVLGVLPLLIQAIESLKVKVVSIDVLVSIAAIGAIFIRNFEESAMVTFLFLFGGWLESKTLAFTRSSIKELIEMEPKTALVLQENGKFENKEIDTVVEKDVILVRTGDLVPVDGKIIMGEGYLNEASITGESIPLSKGVEEHVFAGSILEDGTVQIKATAVGEETTFGKIIELVEEAQDSKSSVEKWLDSFSKVYTPIVIVMAILTWLFTRDIELSITIIVLGCPGALVIGVPISNVAGIGNGARHGVLIKGSQIIQKLANADVMIFDKTGTLTIGQPEVVESMVFDDHNPHHRNYLAAIESESGHPLAKALVRYLKVNSLPKLDKTQVIKGRGIVSIIHGHKVAVGNLELMESEVDEISEVVLSKVQQFEAKGYSIVLQAISGKIVSIYGIRDQIRPGIKTELEKMKTLGVKELIVASGDNQGTVDIVAQELGLTKAIGHLLPEDKANYVKSLQAKGKTVVFVGDGVNDAPSLALADIGIAMGSGTEVAIETSDIVLVKSDINHLNHALGLTKKTSWNIKQNITIALLVVFILILMLFRSTWMNMAVGMFIHEASILLVILNAMRLINYRLKN
ncbi:heavy metal translocating P-type ATPase [Globicatella sanguinis]|uniref:heavy metal translocating P-type ATPase n=1 Tax=Globicatella sanguinis TaxID=13076 RepID=UPI00254318E0|nr:heavy metal translocating P-type ATPase [Globicatella sanguinis]MDK7630996.1 heavy metal translocating P-type ATPase [Globicatella sanguinis]WIK66268.1 heavy metal translocating P-type ATPase [Globicatella sanguinis]WKT55673.1 heavy metal translocating P-type ATPase [Globicatella sanguinis]